MTSLESDDEREMNYGIDVSMRDWEEREMPFEIDRLYELCTRIKANEAEVTEVDATKKYPFNYSGTLGRALLDNTHVTSIALNLPSLFRYEEADATLLLYLQTSSALQVVKLEHGGPKYVRHPDPCDYIDRKRVAQTLFLPIAENPSIHSLTIDCHVSSKAIASLLRNCRPSLENLTLYLGYFGQRGNERVASAFGANQSLKRLTVTDRSLECATNAVLLGLRSHTRLCELFVLCRMIGQNDYEELISLLDSPIPLTTLCLRSFYMYFLHSTCLAESLRNKSSLATLLLQRLEHSLLRKEDRVDLLGFLQTITASSSLKCFELTLNREHKLDACFADMILSPPLGVAPTRSSLQHVGLKDFTSAGFWDYLEENESTARLSAASWSHDSEGAAMLRCLPKLVYLRTLNLDFEWRGNTARDFMRAMRRNGSLHKVSLSSGSYRRYDDRAEESFGSRDFGKLEAFGRRNELVPQLVASPDTAMGDNGSVLLLIPALLQSANAAPRTRPNNVLIGLLSLDQSNVPMNKKQATIGEKRKLLSC